MIIVKRSEHITDEYRNDSLVNLVSIRKEESTGIYILDFHSDNHKYLDFHFGGGSDESGDYEIIGFMHEINDDEWESTEFNIYGIGNGFYDSIVPMKHSWKVFYIPYDMKSVDVPFKEV